MPMVDADWTITRSTGDIRYIGADHDGAATYATVIELHRWLGAFADDAEFGSDDELDIVDNTPSARSTDNIITLVNGFNIDANASEHLFDGSVIQNGGDDIYDGIVNFGNSDVQIQIIQNGAVLADDWWNEAGAGLNADGAAGISHRFMLPTRLGGVDIDGRRLLGTTRTFGRTYSEFPINGTSRGNNVLALSDTADLNNGTLIGTVAGWTSIVNDNEGYTALDINNDTVDEFYYSDWEFGSQTVNDFYERMKWLTRDGSTETLYGLNGELFRGITHEIDIDTPTGTFVEPEEVSWAGGTGQLFAIDSTTAGTQMWIQLLTGTPPADGVTITGGTSAATADVNVTVTERSISSPFAGQSTGSAIIGSYGLGIGTDDLTASDTVFDLDNSQITPPNNVTFTVFGLVAGDRVLVTNDNASDIDLAQDTLNGALTGAAVTSVVTTGAIPTDTPSSGTIRIERDNGLYSRHAYTSYSGNTYTIAPTDFSGNNASDLNNVFISYIDVATAGTQESFTGVYLADRTLFVRVRDGGVTPIVTFETTGTLGNAGGSATAIRTSDE